MSNFYVFPQKGTGTLLDPIRPSVPDGVAWVGTPCDAGTFLIRTETPIPDGHLGEEKHPLPSDLLKSACIEHNVLYDDVVNKWKAGR